MMSPIGIIRQWANRDNGRLFQIGNRSLNSLELFGYAILIVGMVSMPFSRVMRSGAMTVAGSALMVLGFLVSILGERRFARTELERILGDYIFIESINELKAEAAGGPMWQDLEWTKEAEHELLATHAGKWIAVVDRRVLASATSAQDAWDMALATNPNRKPVVRKLP